MKRVGTISVEQAKQLRGGRASSEEVEEYRKLVRELSDDQAEQIELDEGEKFATIRQRLISAGVLAGVKVAVRKQGSMVTFWKDGKIEQSAEEPKPRGRPKQSG